MGIRYYGTGSLSKFSTKESLILFWHKLKDFAVAGFSYLWPTLIFLATLEIAVRGTYFVRNSFVKTELVVWAFGGDIGPAPPWRQSLVEEDAVLAWRGKRNSTAAWMNLFMPSDNMATQRSAIRRFFPLIPEEFRGQPILRASMNSEGFRGDEFTPKKPGIYRIICLGDSWTYGTSVDQKETYTSFLFRELNGQEKNPPFEVLSFAVPGYASYHGIHLIDRALSLDPDLLVIGYAMNEPNMAGYAPPNPKTPASIEDWMHATSGSMITFIKGHYATFQLARYWSDLLRYREKAPVDGLTKDPKWHHDVLLSQQPTWLKDAVDDYKQRLTQMVDKATQHGTSVILLYPEFWRDGSFLRPLKEVAKDRDLTLVDASKLLAQAAEIKSRSRERRLGVLPYLKSDAPDSGHWMDVTFRVHQGKYNVLEALYISGADPALGDFTPNKIRMFDDGTHGDEHPGDGVWSYRAHLPLGVHVIYTFTNSGREGVWEGLDIPLAREIVVGDFVGGILPVDEFGIADLHSDPRHTDAEGNLVIAKALAEAVLKIRQ